MDLQVIQLKKEGGPIGDIVYRQNSGGLMPVMPVATIRPTNVAEEIRNLTGQLRAADPTQKKIIQSKINELKTFGGQNPNLKVGRIEDEFKAKTGAIGKKSAVKEAGISDLAETKTDAAKEIGRITRTGIGNLESKLQQAATDRGITVGQLKQQLAKLEGAIPATGITGIRKGLQAPTLAGMITGITEDTMDTSRQAKIDAAKRGSGTAELLAKLGLSNIDKRVEGETKIGEKLIEADKTEEASKGKAAIEKTTTTWASKVEALGANEKAKMEALVDQYNLQDEISGWPEKLQTKMLKLSKAELDNEKIKAEIDKLKAEAKAELARKPMKAADFEKVVKLAQAATNVYFDEETNSFRTKDGGSVDDSSILNYFDNIIMATKPRTGGGQWIASSMPLVKKAALDVFNQLKLNKGDIKKIKDEQDPLKKQQLAKQIEKSRGNTEGATVRNILQIVKYVDLSLIPDPT